MTVISIEKTVVTSQNLRQVSVPFSLGLIL